MGIAEIHGEKLEVGCWRVPDHLGQTNYAQVCISVTKIHFKIDLNTFFYKLHAMYLITYFKDLYLKLLDNSAKSTQDNLGFSCAFPAAYAL